MAKWRRLLANSRIRTALLLATFCFMCIVYMRTGHEVMRGRRREYSDDLIKSVESPLPSHGLRKSGHYIPIAAVLVICANRPSAVRNHLEQLTKYRSLPAQFPIIISQDGKNTAVTGTIQRFLNDSEHIFHQQHNSNGRNNYEKIANHYKWALDRVFLERNISHVIITEEDLDIASDFFSYFTATRRLLIEDKTLWCVSAWNDNGGVKLTDRTRPELLWRTDFFPGLGWMLSRELWTELSPNFPSIYWDDWMRRPDIRKNRACIRPEVSRTAHNMQLAGKGSSKGLYRKYLEAISLPKEPVDFTRLNLDYLMKEKYDSVLKRKILESKEIMIPQLINGVLPTENAYRATFENARQYTDVAMKYELMFDMRSGMPRTAYSGVVSFLVNGARVYFLSNLLDVNHLGEQPHEQVYNTTWEQQGRYLEFARLYCKSKWKGVCDPENPEMAKWIKQRRIKLEHWGKMVVI